MPWHEITMVLLLSALIALLIVARLYVKRGRAEGAGSRRRLTGLGGALAIWFLITSAMLFAILLVYVAATGHDLSLINSLGTIIGGVIVLRLIALYLWLRDEGTVTFGKFLVRVLTEVVPVVLVVVLFVYLVPR